MFEKSVVKIKNFFKVKEEEKKPTRKTIENLVVFSIILIVTVIFINYIWSKDSSEEEIDYQKVLASEQSTVIDSSNNQIVVLDLENRLKNILSQINGVGEVNVLITYSESSQTVPIYNEDIQQTTTEEKDTQGGTRKITDVNNKKEIVYEEQNGSKTILVQNITSPKIEGAIITAKGASSVTVKNEIIKAVEAVTGLATYKIQVFEMK